MLEYEKEWEGRIKIWLETLAKDLYTPIAPIEWEGFTTMERLGYDRAMAEGDFRPMPTGTRWGREWEYLWVRSTIVVPDSAAGKHLVLRLDAGGESSVYINGAEFGTRRNDWVRDQTHRMSDLLLTESAVPGDRYEVVLEAYASHEFPSVRFGPVLKPFQPKPADELRAVIGSNDFGEWNELAFQLYVDVKLLFEGYKAMSDDLLRKTDIWEALKTFTTMVDFEQDADGRNRDYEAARAYLRPLMEKHNGPTTPQFYAFGHAHIDVAWLWPLAETERKVHRTFAAQLRHMDQYPEYKFLQSQPHLYRMVKQLYPNLYARIKQKVAEGQWIPEGGMWVEADTNVSGGEALIRQFVHGKRFFREEFGVDNKMLWLPDVFGYNAALPQIMKGCGVEYFSTQKIWWAYNGGEQFPYHYFNWVGLDGTAIPSFMHLDYCSSTDAGTMIRRWTNRKQIKDIRGFLVPYGYGDGGGGPSREFIENIRRLNDFEGVPKVKNAHPLEFFEEHPAPRDKYVGELYLQVHRGVQTSQSKTKKGNRKSEISLRETEFWGVAAKLNGLAYPLDRIDECWKQVLLCQFHDIIPGSSIARVYREAEATYASVLRETGEIRAREVAALVKPEAALTVFNSLSFARTVLVPLPAEFAGAAADGKTLPVQTIDGKRVAEVTVPACGSVTLYPAVAQTAADGASARLIDGGAVLENEKLRVQLNARGEIVSAVSKTSGREMAKGLCNELKLFKDIPINYEAWDIDQTYEFNPVELTEDATLELVADGPLEAVVRITRNIGKASSVSQLVKLRRGSARVDFDTTVQWHEQHRLLKVGFDVNIHAEEAVHEIQFGHVKRPNHRSRPYDFDRFEVANHRWTALCEEGRLCAVLNDCKYGVNVFDSSINLSLLRSPYSPDPTCDQGEQQFVYSFFVFDGSLRDSGLVREGCDLNVPVTTCAGARADGSLLEVTADNVFVEAVKPAEDGSDDYVIRLYEALRTGTDTTLTLRLPVASIEQCNMLEEDGTPVEMTKTADGATVKLSFRPFEIKTLRIKPR